MEKVSPVILIKKVKGLPRIVVHRVHGLVIFSEFDDRGRRVEDRFFDFALRPRRFGEQGAYGWRYGYGDRTVEATPIAEPDK